MTLYISATCKLKCIYCLFFVNKYFENNGISSLQFGDIRGPGNLLGSFETFSIWVQIKKVFFLCECQSINRTFTTHNHAILGVYQTLCHSWTHKIREPVLMFSELASCSGQSELGNILISANITFGIFWSSYATSSGVQWPPWPQTSFRGTKVKIINNLVMLWVWWICQHLCFLLANKFSKWPDISGSTRKKKKKSMVKKLEVS